ncbi:hypothetical protein ARMGADRAFT_1091441 [Armillaria gallica]|uniref:Uncharacterized protein n=1 Tax=Armillaria gallica TaxID=47427 RepID=A0A2H3CIX6_ARMGA|nr:hypothetical protein ARMGADRAFT_1091441 [Armillaria gallica]
MIWFSVIIPFIPTFLLPHPSHSSLPFSHDYKSCPLVLLYLIGASPAVVRLLVDFVEQDGSGLVIGICFLFPMWPSSIPSTIHGSMVGEVDLAWTGKLTYSLMGYSNGPNNDVLTTFMQAASFLQD